ncbi:spore germination protein [Hydrogenoanaerobacterium saccharovorans]|uniref:Spore germination protein n=1 Tax=Hydrogenoanaerobacterium saccharovorans TaxID=474960 RepID=A0A1H7ZSE9_9FIRM|nr:glycosyl hydrolase family 18 protein [Hydrogenoanaerobacterium saccharovorans]RPF48413.1 spore germination protein [Hydrogenoanaerobacterium saccharovorans]SEM61360.1 spore germination protein [Hydrogenoanaerobacterium saccharovorans]
MTIHVVQPGDTLLSIANRYGVSQQRIIMDNGLYGLPYLVVGQALIILEPATIHTVQPGETLYSIANLYGITPIILLQRNPNLIRNRQLWVGEQITINFRGEPQREVSINGYAYPFINRNILQHALPFLTDFTIFGYGFTVNGDLIPVNDQELINLAYQYSAAPILLLSSITEEGTFSGERASLLFNDIQLQNTVINHLLDVMKQKGYLGLDIDFEYVRQEDSESFLRFLENATRQMHENGFRVNVDLAPKTSSEQAGLLYEAHNYAAIGAIADTVLLMTYEWGYTYGPPMAVAPLPNVRQVVSYAVTQIPKEKIMLGIPNYGYNWMLPYERGITQATTIGNDYAIRIAAENGVTIQFDQTAQSPFFEYWAQNGRKHIVWFEDVRSIQGKFNLITEFGLRGGGYWNLMRPFAQNWALLSQTFSVKKVV